MLVSWLVWFPPRQLQTFRGEPEGRAVKARDLEVLGDLKFSISEEFEDITITKLYAGQTIDFIARANMGYGRDHVKWQPVVGTTFYARQHAVLHDKKAAKVLWKLGLSIKEKDFGKTGRIEDISLVDQMKKDLLFLIRKSYLHFYKYRIPITLSNDV